MTIPTSPTETPVSPGLRVAKTALCECADGGCPACNGKCSRSGLTVLYRSDMGDETGTRFCEECAEDASECGLFAELEDGRPFDESHSAINGDNY